MPYTFSAVDKLLEQPLIASATCVDLVRLFVTGLAGKPTSSWKQGVGVMDAHRAGTVIPRGTAIATFEPGCYLPRCASKDAGRCHHAALLLQATPDAVHGRGKSPAGHAAIHPGPAAPRATGRGRKLLQCREQCARVFRDRAVSNRAKSRAAR
ncbi:MAG: BPSL0067 family protein [Pseudomonadota bacterium]